jgi:hypothetical protein
MSSGAVGSCANKAIKRPAKTSKEKICIMTAKFEKVHNAGH